MPTPPERCAVIEKSLTHLGRQAHLPPKGQAREPGQDFAAWAALAVEKTGFAFFSPLQTRQGACLGSCRGRLKFRCPFFFSEAELALIVERLALSIDETLAE